MSELTIDVVTPAGVVYTGSIESCSAPGTNGQFQVLNQHASMLANIAVGEIKLVSEGREKILATSGGYCEVKDNKISLMVETAEFAETIDVNRARAAKERAERRLKEKEGIDIPRAKLALARALNRLKISSQN